MAKPTQIVEVATVTEDGIKPVGIMNAEQAEALPDTFDIVVSEVVEGLPSDDDPPIPPNVTED